MPAAAQLAGVKRPRQRSEATIAKPMNTDTEMAAVAVGIAPRISIPAAHTRKIKSPQPAAPAGNMLNNLCTKFTLTGCHSPDNLKKA
jgi:hypothetical protein